MRVFSIFSWKGTVACRIAHRAGVATAAEPDMARLHGQATQLSAERGDILAVLPNVGLIVADVSVVYPAASRFLRAAVQTDGAAAAVRDRGKRLKYGVGEQMAAGGFTPPSTETSGRMSSVAHAFLKSLTDAAMSSAEAESKVTVTAFRATALREVSVALTRRNEIVYREALSMYATAGGTAATAGAAVPTVDCE
jgi:hypothetical protein